MPANVGPGCAFVLLLLLFGGCSPDPGSSSTPPALRVSSILGNDADTAFARARDVIPFEFPRDHGAHPEYRSEWWYLTVVLTDADGHDYGVQFTLFRYALSAQPASPGPWQTGQAYMAHLGVTDVRAGLHEGRVAFARGHPEQAGVQAAPLRAYLKNWHLAQVSPPGAPLALQLTATARADATEPLNVSLRVEQARPVLLQGNAGLSAKGPEQASYYYSLPRMSATGTLRIGEREVAVTGQGWLDREWSTSVLGSHLVGWDWFALQLADGRDLMLFNLRRHDGARDPYDYGVIATDDGEQRKLGPADFALTPTRWWTDDAGTEWPVAWRFELGQETFDVEALLDDQLMSLGVIYWEGIVAVRRDGQRLGGGYMELTGYREGMQAPRAQLSGGAVPAPGAENDGAHRFTRSATDK